MTASTSVGNTAAELQFVGAPARLAFRLCPETVRTILPRDIIGTYLLLRGAEPIYVGRSDRCLRERLASHNHLGVASHVVWEPARSPSAAFHLEAYWYHRHHETLINQVHPAVPALSWATCPFCTDNSYALDEAFKATPTRLNHSVSSERNHLS